MPPAPRRPPAQPIEGAEVAHLAVVAGDVIQALPVFLSRQLSDLKELDAVLAGSAQAILSKFNKLLNMIVDDQVEPLERLKLLREVTEDSSSYKLGAEDKIRVATGCCETVHQHATQLDLIVSLLTGLMPESMINNLPSSTAPAGYPNLFPNYLSGATQAATTPAPYHARARQEFFALPPASGAATSRQSAMQYTQAVEMVNRYRNESNLPPVKPAKPPRPIIERPKKKEPAPSSVPFPAAAERRSRTSSQQGVSRDPAGVEVSTSPNKKARKPPSPVDNKAPGSPNDHDLAEPVLATTTHLMDVDQEDDQAESSSKKVKLANLDTALASASGEQAPIDSPGLSAGGRKRSASNKKGEDSPEPPNPPPRTKPKRKASQAFDDSLDVDENAVPAPSSNPGHSEGEERKYCYCNRISYGEMIGCDDDLCEKEWFHLECVGLDSPPNGSWFCDDCKVKHLNNSKRKRV